jgi:integrase
MARTLNRLTASKVATAKGPHTYSDGGRLYLQVDGNLNRRFIYIFARDGRQREISLGSYPALSLSDARKKRDEMNTSLARGEPLAGPRQKSGQTFRAVAQQVIERRSSSWHGKVSANHWRVSIEGHCAKLLDRQIHSIGLEDVLAVLRPLHDRAANFAAITRARVEDIFDYAQARGLIPADKPNPADRRRLRLLLPAAPAAIHRPALAYADLPLLIAELREINIADGRVVAARALEFAVTTALRAKEAYRVTLAEIDFGARLLTVPAARMKGGKRAHVVPLSDRAIQIVRELEALRGDSDVVFPSRFARGPIASTQPLRLLRSLRADCTVHGFRSSFRDWCGDETMFPREVAEAALAHTIGGTEGAYRRLTAIEKRRDLMERWSGFCSGEQQQGATVIALRAG